MKYWLYSEGNILGPYEPAEMLALPAFAEESLVCPESATGDNPGDWRPAAQMAEISSALSVGVGRSVGAGSLGGAYEYETGFSATMRYFEDKEPATGAGYGDLLDTIDNILGAYKEGKETPARQLPESDYDLAEKFDIRLSRIQEELEAARWEKNLLLEKIRMKETEDRKNRERIQELEARLKSETGKSDLTAREMEQVRHLNDLKEKSETIRKIEEIRKEEIALNEGVIPAPRLPDGTSRVHPEESGVPEMESRVLKSMKPSTEIKLERALEKEASETGPEAGITSRKFKSLGQTQPPAYVYGSHYDKPLPGPEPAPPGSFNPDAAEPLPQQAGGLVYDFTVVTAKPENAQQFRIEPRQEAQAAQPQQFTQPYQQPAQQAPQQFAQPYQQPAQTNRQQAPAARPQPVKTPTYDFGIPQQAAAQPQPAQFRMPGAAGPQPGPVAGMEAAQAQAPADSPDKTQRMPVAPVKGKPETKAAPEKKVRKGGKLAFIAVLVVFGSMAAGGLGYFFMGEGVSFSEFSMLNIGGKKKTPALASQLEATPAAPKAQQAAQPPVQPAAQQPAAQQPEPAQQPQAAAPQPAAEPEPQGGENIKKAMDIVKGYKLSGGRGTIASWFANSFLTGSSGGASQEEWTATPLHGDILVVQYRLIRPKQDPMVYQFEVDAAKQDIVRGINNNAIDLLESSSKEKSASAAPVKKPAAKPKAKKPSRPKEIPILPLPDAPAAGPAAEQEPTGMENAQGEGSEKVKYLKAQESDEELF